MSKKFVMRVLVMVLGLPLLLTACTAISNAESSLHIGTIATSQSVSWTAQASLYAPIEGLDVIIKPTSKAKSDVQYTVDLYESGEYRATQTVSWNDDELSTFTNKDVIYSSVSEDEVDNYIGAGKNLMDVYTIKVYATVTPNITTASGIINQSKNTSLTLTYPKGGEILHVGQTINITWKSTNLTKDATILICLSNDSGKNLFPLLESLNTGSYQWVVTDSWVKLNGYGDPLPSINASYIGSHNRIELDFDSNDVTVLPSLSATDFTITN